MSTSPAAAARARGANAARPAADVPVLSLLRAQHGEISALLAGVAGSAGQERRAAFAALRELLAAHEAIEELLLRPVSHRAALRGVSAARNGEERQIVEMLTALERLDVDSAGFTRGFTALDEAIIQHTRLEEAEEFPAVAARLSQHEQEALGRWARRAFPYAGARPHPATAGSPLAQWTIGPFTALLDHARERLNRHPGPRR
jgi:hypothetical protein